MTQFASALYPKKNPSNPILLSFRANDLSPDPKQWVKWLERPTLGPWFYADRHHVDHARRVLSRLAALSG